MKVHRKHPDQALLLAQSVPAATAAEANDIFIDQELLIDTFKNILFVDPVLEVSVCDEEARQGDRDRDRDREGEKRYLQ